MDNIKIAIDYAIVKKTNSKPEDIVDALIHIRAIVDAVIDEHRQDIKSEIRRPDQYMRLSLS